jgi:hypothetical protein
MHYTRKYSGTRAECTDAAVKDCKEWYGKTYGKKLAMLSEHILNCREAGHSRRAIHDSMHMLCGIGGVQGYWPIRAIIREALRLNAQKVEA